MDLFKLSHHLRLGLGIMRERLRETLHSELLCIRAQGLQLGDLRSGATLLVKTFVRELKAMVDLLNGMLPESQGFTVLLLGSVVDGDVVGNHSGQVKFAELVS